MLTVSCILWFTAFIGTLIAALGKVPLWVPVLIATIAGLVTCIPLR
jgi:hypothetical protein